MKEIQTTLKSGVIVKVGKKETTDKNGNKFKYDSVKVGIIFDFDPDVWYNGFVFPNQAEKLREGVKMSVEVYDNVGSNGVTYKNFRIPRKPDASVELKGILEELTKRVAALESKHQASSKPPVESFNDANDGGDINPEDFDF